MQGVPTDVVITGAKNKGLQETPETLTDREKLSPPIIMRHTIMIIKKIEKNLLYSKPHTVHSNMH